MAKTLHRWCLLTNLSSHCWDHSQTIPSFHGNSLARVNLCQNHNKCCCRIFVGHSTRTTWGSNPRYIFQKVTCASKIFAPIPNTPKLSTKKGKQKKRHGPWSLPYQLGVCSLNPNHSFHSLPRLDLYTTAPLWAPRQQTPRVDSSCACAVMVTYIP